MWSVLIVCNLTEVVLLGHFTNNLQRSKKLFLVHKFSFTVKIRWTVKIFVCIFRGFFHETYLNLTMDKNFAQIRDAMMHYFQILKNIKIIMTRLSVAMSSRRQIFHLIHSMYLVLFQHVNCTEHQNIQTDNT